MTYKGMEGKIFQIYKCLLISATTSNLKFVYTEMPIPIVLFIFLALHFTLVFRQLFPSCLWGPHPLLSPDLVLSLKYFEDHPYP